MSRNYATSMCHNSTCMLKRDYSYIVNGRCLECKFCYKHVTPAPKQKIRMAKMLLFEEQCSPNLYKVPITISRFCDPNYNNTARTNSLLAVEHILHKGGQVIWKTAKVNDLPIAWAGNPNVQVQGRIITADTKTGNIVRNLIAPNFDSTGSLLNQLRMCKDWNVPAAISFDPLILGLNDADLYIVAHQASRVGVKKIIVKQLFATDYFKTFLTSHVGKDCSNLLSERVGEYWTYKSELLIKLMHDVLIDTKNTGVEFAMCSNKEIDNLISSHSNCCLFDNPIGVYDLSKKSLGRTPTVITKES